jgi:hypothetical protein
VTHCSHYYLLFNIAIDPVLRALDNHNGGFKYGDSTLQCLAFADDISIIAKSSKEAQYMLLILEDRSTKCGLNVSISKCATFRIIKGRKSWAISDPELYRVYTKEWCSFKNS